MYIIKNALRGIVRFKWRNLLMGIIALIVAALSCFALFIGQAAENAWSKGFDGLSVTASISYGRSGGGNNGGGRPEFGNMDFSGGEFWNSGFTGNSASLSVDEYLKYAGADSVESFYYTLTAYFNGTEGFTPVSVDDEDDEGNYLGELGGAFAVIGGSDYSAIPGLDKDAESILMEGAMFDGKSEELTCIISEKLADLNELVLGDSVVISNPSLEDETYTLTVVGIYESNEDDGNQMFTAGADNSIYMSAAALQSIIDTSEENSADTKITGNVSATYFFENVDDYYAFEEEVRSLGLDESYAVTSSELSALESSIAPLNALGKTAGGVLSLLLP